MKNLTENQIASREKELARNADIRAGYALGFKMPELAEQYGITRQRVWQIIHKAPHLHADGGGK